jgi:hypothetical protein
VFRGGVRLIDYCNNLVDEGIKPKIEMLSDNKEVYAKQVYPNFIYNRFDIRYGKDFNIFKVIENNDTFYIPYHIEKSVVTLGVWLTPISYYALDMLVKYIFKLHKKVKKIQIRYSINQYEGLNISNHWSVALPNTKEEFDITLSANTRRNTKRKPKKIITDFGSYFISHYSREEITPEIVQKYLDFKFQTLGIDYKIKNPMEFIKKFYITDCYVLYLKEQIAATAFFSHVGGYTFFENFSYDKQYAPYSLGDVIYYHAICDLITNHFKFIYLGDGWQDFKSCYNGINNLVFDGYVRKKTIFSKVKKFLKQKGLLCH